MKYPILIFVIALFCSNYLQSQNQSFGWDQKFEIGKQYELFGNNVKLRATPSMKGEVLTLIEIGNQIEILNQSNQTDAYQKATYHWYQVKYKDQVGYILGALIAHYKQVGVSDKSLSFYFRFKYDEETSIGKMTIKTYRGSQLLDAKQTDLLAYSFSIKIIGNKGMENIDDIVQIDYWAESCGAYGGVSYFFWIGNDLIHAVDLVDTADGGAYHYSERFIFPADSEGRARRIIYLKEEGEMKEEETEWYITESHSRIIKWDASSKKFIPSDFKMKPK
ncbi:MAG: SH3 domain-containing protein [Bacteroidota bacterium]